MSIVNLCRGEVVIVPKETSLQDVAVLMQARGVGFVAVTTDDGNMVPIGVITDRDIVLRAVAKNLDMSRDTVEKAMSQALVTVKSDANITEVIEIMEERKIRRVLVLDEANHLCGVVSTDDLVRFVSGEMAKIGNLFQEQTGTSLRHRTHEFTRMA